MRESGKVAIATFVMRNKEYLVTIRPEGDVIALETMYFSDEVRSPEKELPNLPEVEDPSDREIKMAELLIESMEGSWDPKRYRDTHRQKIEALIEEKRQGKEIVAATSAPTAKVVNLMDALNASIKATQSPKKKASTPTRRPAAEATVAKKATKPRATKSARKAS
jgi:DNA end-binding protein Ku